MWPHCRSASIGSGPICSSTGYSDRRPTAPCGPANCCAAGIACRRSATNGWTGTCPHRDEAGELMNAAGSIDRRPRRSHDPGPGSRRVSSGQGRRWIVRVINEIKGIQVGIDQIKGYLYPTEAEQAAAYELLVELNTGRRRADDGGGEHGPRHPVEHPPDVRPDPWHLPRTRCRCLERQRWQPQPCGDCRSGVERGLPGRCRGDGHPILCEYEARREQEAPFVSEGESGGNGGRRHRSAAPSWRRSRGTIRSYIDTLSRIAGAFGGRRRRVACAPVLRSSRSVRCPAALRGGDAMPGPSVAACCPRLASVRRTGARWCAGWTWSSWPPPSPPAFEPTARFFLLSTASPMPRLEAGRVVRSQAGGFRRLHRSRRSFAASSSIRALRTARFLDTPRPPD